MSSSMVLRLLVLCALGWGCQTPSEPGARESEREYDAAPGSTMQETLDWAEDDSNR